jgi:G3E family GTPase
VRLEQIELENTMQDRQQPAPIPVSIIGGFLGAGKTTLLNHVLSENHGVRAGVLVNDFGAINIDAKLVVGVEGETVNLANGCVCCTIRDDLMGACLGLLQRPDPPEHLLIETSGVSDPIPVLETFLQPELEALFSLSSTLVVVDAEHLPGLRGEMAHLARVQIQAADHVVVNKVDLVTSEALAKVKQRVHKIAPGSRIIEVSHGRVPLEMIFEPNERPSGPPRDGDSRSDADHSHEHPLLTWHWTSDQPLSLPRLRSIMETLPETIYRAKGIVYLEELPMYRIVLQMVGKRYNLRDSDRWGSARPGSEIVMIGGRDGIDPEELQRAFDACVGTGDEAQSPILRLARKLALDTRNEPPPQERDLRKPTRRRARERR